jgi:two-component system, response regulator PdtaR
MLWNLPLRPAFATGDPEPPMCHVLIIEDDALAAMDIEGALRSTGAHTFSFADTERSAVACAREQRPDLITSDVMLSDGFGHMAVRAIQAEHGVIPVIYITGTPDQCADCPPDQVLEKPFSTERLLILFDRLSAEPPQARAPVGPSA